MGHLAEDADLVVGELRQLGSHLELVRVHHLHRVQLLRRLVLRPIDVAILPSTDLLLQDVVLDHLVHALLILLSMTELMNGRWFIFDKRKVEGGIMKLSLWPSG
jgi:uncharacterized membrane protein